MPSIYALKPRFQALLRPVAATLANAGITANHVTLAAMAISIAYGAALAATQGAPALLLGLPPLLLLRMALNAVDGMLAREHDQKSNLGFILNELGDVVSDATLYLPFALITGVEPALIVALVTLALTAEFTGLLAIPLGHARNYAGPFGKSDRAAFFSVFAILLGVETLSALWLELALVAGIGLALATIVNRARAAVRA